MTLMGEGLAGNMHKFYRYVKDSPWVGGNSEYALLHEAFPYWLNGIVPLAYGIEKPELAKNLKNDVEKIVNQVLDRQAHDGWLGPETLDSGMRNLWGRMPLLLAFVQLLDADPGRYKKTVLPAMRKYLDLAYTMLNDQGGYGYLHPSQGSDRYPKGAKDVLSEEDHGWGQVRAADMMISLQWLYEQDDGQWRPDLMKMMQKLRLNESDSLDWANWYTKHGNAIRGPNFRQTPEATNKKLFPFTHGVNVGQGS
jgi:hypothetical protein